MLRVIGLMSGTSLDGVDAALVETDGTGIGGFGPSAFRPYSAEEQAVLRAALGLWPGDDPVRLGRAQQVILAAHLEVLAQLPTPDLLGFHGQTLAHDPAAGRSHQLGDGAELARRAGVRTVWDMRGPDLAAGGQGAPLVPFFHHALARRAGLDGRVAFLNIGGVANVTLADLSFDDPGRAGALLAFDTGPGNALINDLMQIRRGQPFDRDGATAASGRSHAPLVDAWLADPWFAAPPPKSLDRDRFRAALSGVAHLSDADAAATLALFTARSVARGLALGGPPPRQLILCGGGRHNPVLARLIAGETGLVAAAIETLGFDGDMTEAQAFAFLAARAARGLQLTSASTTGRRRAAGPPRFSG